MGILQRVVNITKAAANEMLDKMENPVMMLNHYLRDLDDEIASTERTLVQQQAQERMLQAKHNELSEQVSYYENKAEQAATEDRESDARTALEAKLLYAEQAEETLKQKEFAGQAVAELSLRVELLKEEKTRLQGKRTELLTRVRQADSHSGYSSPSSLHGSDASRGFERIEQQLMEKEALNELARGRSGADASYSSVNQQNEQRNARVDEELQRLLNKKSNS